MTMNKNKPSDMVLTWQIAPNTSNQTIYGVCVDKPDITQWLDMIIEHYSNNRLTMGNVEFYGLLATKLSGIVRKNDPWTWRYVYSVHTGSLAPSKLFIQAVQALGVAIDGAPPVVAWSEEVSIFAPPGLVRGGAIVLLGSKPCAGPGCNLMIVSRGKYCSDDCRKAARRLRSKS